MQIITVLITGLFIFATNSYAEDCGNCSAAEDFSRLQQMERASEVSVDLQERVDKAKSLAETDKSLDGFRVETEGRVVYVANEIKVCRLERTKRLGPGPMLDGFWNSYFLNCKDRNIKAWPPAGE